MVNPLILDLNHVLDKKKKLKITINTNKEKKVKEKTFFKERCHGIFTNHITDEKLHQKVEEIRAIIKSS